MYHAIGGWNASMQMYSGHYHEISYVHEETQGWGPEHSPLAEVRWPD